MSEENGLMTANEIFEGVDAKERQWIINTVTENIVYHRHELLKTYFDPRRDIRKECGYPETTEIEKIHLKEMYERHPIAARVVEVLPEETWRLQPKITEDKDAEELTVFEKSWDQLGKKLQGKGYYQDEEGSCIWEALQRVDMLSGIGSFGGVLLGLSDLEEHDELSKPAPGYEEGEPQKASPEGLELLFLRVFDEDLINITQYETDPTSARFGQPVMYEITFEDPRHISQSVAHATETRAVHWSRVIHVADNLKSSEIFGTPRMLQVWNRLLDLDKLYGGGGEGFWKGAFPGLSFETHPQMSGEVEIDKAAVRKAAERYANTLQRFLVLEGMTAKSLAPQFTDPSTFIDTIITAICVKLGVPKRIFVGSERGELASSQDADAWNSRLMARQRKYVTPRLIAPFIDRLILLGILPEPTGYSVEWPDLTSPSSLERAEVALKQTDALTKYVAGNVNVVIQPADYLTKVLDFTEEEAAMMLATTEEAYSEESFEEDEDLLTEEVMEDEETDGTHISSEVS